MKSSDLDARYQKWIKQGRGAGSGKDYQPWLTVRDLPSMGRSHRIWGTKTQRTHHLMSDIELQAFFLFDWHLNVTDIREQFPLRLDDTLEIASAAGIRHPCTNGNSHVMSTDFLVDISQPKPARMAIQVKMSSDLVDPRTIEKLEIEKRYWHQKGVPWYLLTERQIPEVVTKNIAWLYPAQLALEEQMELLDWVAMYVDFFQKHPHSKISRAAMMLDQAYSLEPGESLQKIRTLMALRVLLFDIRKSWSDLAVGELQLTPSMDSLRRHYVANQ